MTAAQGESGDQEVLAQVSRRWQALDPVLPDPSFPIAAGGERFTAGPPGAPTAVAGCGHWIGEAGTLELCWGTAQRFGLTARVAGPDVGGALDELLSAWHDHLTAQDGLDLDDPDTSVNLSWPSRDVAGVRALVRHGLQPMAVVAVRTGRAALGEGGDLPPGVRIRRAAPADLEAVIGLEHEVVRYDANFGQVIDRPWTTDALRQEAAPALAADEPWVWLAERDGRPVGVLHAQRPADAGWIAGLTARAPVAYNLLTGVSPTERGGGIGAALTARFHTEAAAAGVAVTLLHHTVTNPRSVPFWSQQGYRPLWTIWEISPASTLR
ncbi:MAG: GNAT family N-acetyltransferase [Actinobacteria bacterium]|nr:GNAT family N-acetyltransferase [Actinomycetota bacterium]